MFGRHHEGRGSTMPILKCLSYNKKTDQYFFIIPFASSRLWSKILLKILSSMPEYTKGLGRATPIFNLEKYYKKTDEYFFIIPFALSSMWSKIFLKILTNMVYHLMGCGRKRLNIFVLIFLQRVGNERADILASKVPKMKITQPLRSSPSLEPRGTWHLGQGQKRLLNRNGEKSLHLISLEYGGTSTKKLYTNLTVVT